MDEVRRQDDGELCGFVTHGADGWRSVTVFGATLGIHETRDEAVKTVLADGLASLADRWTLRDTSTGEEQIVCIQEASPDGLVLALGYYSLPGVPTMRVTSAELADGSWVLHRG